MFLPQDFSVDLLSPGDRRAAALNAKEFVWDGIRTLRDPNFQIAYDTLWAEFGSKNEMEQIAALEGRFKLAPAMLYEMLLVRKNGVIAGVRDHTAVWADDEVIVHLSHNLPRHVHLHLPGDVDPIAVERAFEVAAPRR